jgi:tetratricopeptide (TPR) repeat protein
MGVVYRACDLVLDREVAVKLLADGPNGGAAAAARFLDEARITAQLQHPGVPAVYQAGVAADGRPYLAMKLIGGRTLAAARPAAEAVAGVFEKVCEAVGYAHSRGVIHRDLKPGNVMVGEFGEVQVMDWGVAKVLGDPAGRPENGVPTHKTAALDPDGTLTLPGSVLGTPAFMAPEQAAADTARVGRPSDVFALGAVLYWLLTGRPLYAGPNPEAVRRAAEDGPTAAALARLDACGADPGLAALCKRCLAFDPLDRPADAGELAAAVARLRASAEGRARRAETAAAEERVRRRLQVRLGGLAAAALLAGGLAATLQWGRAERALAAVTVEQREAELARGRTLEVLRSMTGDLATDRAQRAAELSEADRRYLTEVGRLWAEVAAGRGDGPEARGLRAEGQYRVGLISYNLSEHAAAERAYRASLDELAPLLDGPAAPAHRRQAAVTQAALGALLVYTGRRAEAEGPTRAAYELWKRLATDSPADRPGRANAANALGVLLRDSGRPAAAVEPLLAARDEYRQLAAETPGDPWFRRGLARASANLGAAWRRTGRPADAERALAEALAGYTELVQKHPHLHVFRSGVAFTHSVRGPLFQGLGRMSEAEEAFRAAHDEYRRLADDQPRHPYYREEQASAEDDLGRFLAAAGRPAEAEKVLDTARSMWDQLAAGPRNSPQVRYGRCGNATALAAVYRAAGRPDKAERLNQEALAELRRLAAETPADPVYRYDAGDCLALSAAAAVVPADAGAVLGPGAAATDALAAAAVAELAAAVAAGYRDADTMAGDGDLRAIRHRDDFKGVLDRCRELALAGRAAE